eukprot:scaffold15718_cov107-Isochrysis_galbana.AAC.6
MRATTQCERARLPKHASWRREKAAVAQPPRARPPKLSLWQHPPPNVQTPPAEPRAPPDWRGALPRTAERRLHTTPSQLRPAPPSAGRRRRRRACGVRLRGGESTGGIHAGGCTAVSDSPRARAAAWHAGVGATPNRRRLSLRRRQGRASGSDGPGAPSPAPAPARRATPPTQQLRLSPQCRRKKRRRDGSAPPPGAAGLRIAAIGTGPPWLDWRPQCSARERAVSSGQHWPANAPSRAAVGGGAASDRRARSPSRGRARAADARPQRAAPTLKRTQHRARGPCAGGKAHRPHVAPKRRRPLPSTADLLRRAGSAPFGRGLERRHEPGSRGGMTAPRAPRPHATAAPKTERSP